MMLVTKTKKSYGSSIKCGLNHLSHGQNTKAATCFRLSNLILSQ